MKYLSIDPALIVFFVGVWFRILSMLIWLPVLGDSQIPPMIKIGISFMLALVIYPMVPKINGVIDLQMSFIIYLMLKEAFIGLIIGFVAKIVFYGVMMAAQFVGYQMGFGMASLLDPSTGTSVSPFSQFQTVLATALFLTMNFHHMFIQAIYSSFEIVPLTAFNPSPLLGSRLISLSGEIFTIGIKLSAPVLTALIFTMFSLGLIARTVPQVNVFVLSFPISMVVGFLVFVFSLSFFYSQLGKYYSTITGQIFDVLALVVM